MPLKPLFPRKPLIEIPFVMLPAWRITPDGVIASIIKSAALALTATYMKPYHISAVYRAAHMLRLDNIIQKCEEIIDYYLSFDYSKLSPTDMAYISKAQLMRFEVSFNSAFLLPLMKWMKDLPLLLDDEVLINPGDLLEVIITLYNLTGKKHLLSLVDLIKSKSPDWTRMYHTYNIVKPVSVKQRNPQAEKRLVPENEPISSLAMTQFLLIDGLSLASNLKTTTFFSMVSGGAKDHEAASTGFQRIMRWHGLPYGIFSANPYVAGKNERDGTDSCIIGELAYSLSRVILSGSIQPDVLETIMFNVLDKILDDNGIHRQFAYNNCALSVPYADAPDHTAAVLNGISAYYQSALLYGQNNHIKILFFSDYTCTFSLDKTTVQIKMKYSHDLIEIWLYAKDCFSATLDIRIPAWMENVNVSMNHQHIQNSESYVIIKSVFDKDTIILIRYTPVRTITKGYRDRIICFNGPLVSQDPLNEI